jgi:hypothetical protein
MNFWSIAIVGVLLSSSVAHAATAAEAKSKAKFKAAQVEYDVGRFEEALKDFSDAYQLKPLPGFLFNIAQCHRQLGNFERARFFYRRYLDLSPTTPKNADQVAELLKQMDETAPDSSRGERHVDAPPTEPHVEPPPVERHVDDPPVERHVDAPAVEQHDSPSTPQQLTVVPMSGGLRRFSWIPLAAGAVAAGVGAVLLVQARGQYAAIPRQDGQTPIPYLEATGRATSGKGLQTAGWVSVGVGVAAVLAGGSMFVFGKPTVMTAVTPEGAAVTVAGAF